MDNSYNTIKITLTDTKPSLYNSKVGGDFIAQNPKGAFLAQINLSELPPINCGLPQTGWLQFFIGDDELLGLDWGDKKGTFEVRYVKSLEGEIHKSDYEFTPIVKESGMDFEPAYENLSIEDYRFAQSDIWKNANEEEKDKLYETYSGYGCKLLGYPAFTQYDPRESKKTLQKYDTLLFQLDSCLNPDKIMWGDSGIGNFFISQKDLLKEDFSDILYNWDCC